MNAELIKALRCCACAGGCTECPRNNLAHECWVGLTADAADALEAAEARIAELEAQIPKEGEWIKKEIKKYCPRDCWYPSTFAIEGTWNEKEGSYMELEDGFCSVCLEQDDQYYKDKYCPNCGSRMQTVTDCHALEKGEQ